MQLSMMVYIYYEYQPKYCDRDFTLFSTCFRIFLCTASTHSRGIVHPAQRIFRCC